jgi:hypothetical protein
LQVQRCDDQIGLRAQIHGERRSKLGAPGNRLRKTSCKSPGNCGTKLTNAILPDALQLVPVMPDDALPHHSGVEK